MLLKILRISLFPPLLICANSTFNIPTKFTGTVDKLHHQSRNFTFKDYLQKFNPSNVWEKIDQKNKLKGINRTVAEEFDNMYNAIDGTDELLNVKVQNGAPKIVMQKDGRRAKIFPFVPPGSYGAYHYNRYNLKERFMELMKQAIYQARYKMVIMQNFRERYKSNSLYKMGFLMSKTDNACKNFYKFAYKASKDCSTTRQNLYDKNNLIDVLATNERLINLWFEVDLLVDLVIKNDENCRRMLNEVMTNRKRAWKFYD